MKKLTTEEWIDKVKKNHDDRYVYDEKCVYTGVHDKITIYCKEHGYFTICADSFMKGANCPKCGKEKRTTKFEEYVEKANQTHGGKYTYDEDYFNKGNRKIKIICPKHGEFLQDKFSHLNGQGCPECAHERKFNKDFDKLTKEFIKKAKEVHGDKYDYSKVKYINAKTKVCIICPIHGEFFQTPDCHLNGRGCKKCSSERTAMKQKFSNEEFIKRAREIHGDKYIYNNDYTKMNNKIVVTCPIHGDFEILAGNHIYNGQGCPKCGIEKCRESNTMSTEEFIKKCKEKHNYDYSITTYNGWNNDIQYICHAKDGNGKEHGIITQKASIHYNGYGCNKCNSSHLEKEVMMLFDNNGIKYTYQKRFEWLGMQSLDFYIDEYNVSIECQGEQHYRPIKFFGGEDNLIYTVNNDTKKYNICKEHNIPIIYYTHIDNDYKHCSCGEELLNELKYIGSFNKLFKFISDKCKCSVDYENSTIDIDEYNTTIYFIKTYNGNDKDELINILDNASNKSVIIYDYEYYSNEDIVQGKISHILGISEYIGKIPARECTVKEIKSSVSKLFLNKNHIQGYASATVYLGAYYNNILVGVMEFKKESENYYNLVRFATDNRYICQGIGGKLFSFFIKNYKFEYIKTFADRRWTNSFDNNLYVKLGFELDDVLEPDYQYYYDGKLMHKFNCRKNLLSKKFDLPLTMTESQMTEKIGMKKVWSCGLYKYLYKKHETAD